MGKVFVHGYDYIISVENLLAAWQEFLRGKKQRKDVQHFFLNLMDNILDLHHDLKTKIYRHGPYHHFKINDPKLRDIHKASVRDRLIHHAVYSILYPFFAKKFISDSFSCQNNKGTHKAINRFKEFNYKASQNHTKTCYVLKGDIKKFFANIDHRILLNILEKHISDNNVLWLLNEIISSFNLFKPNTGLPLGNLTSQLLVNIYMNEFDQFIKHKLKIKYYIRYADDFVILSDNYYYLKNHINHINNFLNQRLKLVMHQDKVFIKTLSSGVDFLGWVHFPEHRVLRTKTKSGC